MVRPPRLTRPCGCRGSHLLLLVLRLVSLRNMDAQIPPDPRFQRRLGTGSGGIDSTYRKSDLTPLQLVSCREPGGPATAVWTGAPITQMLMSPVRLEEKAIWFPSGDQADCLSLPTSSVTWNAVPPVAGITQISLLPDRFELKAIMLPSGDQEGM